MMKKFLLGVAAGALMAGAASAADLPVRPALVAVPVFTWSGFYVGANVGYIDGNRTNTVGTPLFGNAGLNGGALYNNIHATAATGRGSDLSAILGGGGIGYNWQFGTIVAGVETDLQASSTSRETRDVFLPNATFPNTPVIGAASSSQRFNYIGTVRARLGYTVFDNLLVYVTGGLAYGEKDSSTSFNFNATGGGSAVFPNYGTVIGRSKTETGYTVGGGLEYMLDANWSVKGEALYYDLGKSRASGQFNSFGQGGAVFTTTGVNGSTDNKGVIARFGVNYKFTSW